RPNGHVGAQPRAAKQDRASADPATRADDNGLEAVVRRAGHPLWRMATSLRHQFHTGTKVRTFTQLDAPGTIDHAVRADAHPFAENDGPLVVAPTLATGVQNGPTLNKHILARDQSRR